MDKYLNVARAAKLAGVSRGEIQEEIRQERLSAFEGSVSFEALKSIYPHVSLEDDSEILRAEQLKDQALGKFQPEQVSEMLSLAQEVARLRLQLVDAQMEIGKYRGLVSQLHERLLIIQEQCTRRQKLVLQALVSWMLTRLDQRL